MQMGRYPANPQRLRGNLEQYSNAVPRSNRTVIWVVSIAIFMPYTIAVFVGDLKFTPGKLVVMVLFLPAAVHLITQSSKGLRHLVATDFFALATSIWMIGAPALSGSDALTPAVSLMIEFLGPYMIGRAYFFGKDASQEFVQVLKIILVMVIGLALLDTLSGRFVTNETTAYIFNVPDARSVRGDAHFHRELFGIDVIRATSTLDHPILYGTFCAMAAAILLYSESNASRRIFYLILCIAGCLLSASSAPLLGIFIAIGVRSYDWLFRRYPWRWKALIAALVCFVSAVFLISQNPVSWLIGHLTLDEETGYYRLLIWQHALALIDIAPWLGNPYATATDEILSVSTDSVWLVEALGLGVPLVVLHFLTSVSTFTSSGDGTERLSTGLTLVLALFIIIGLTVHFWNTLWLFWGLCIGVRASLNEYYKAQARSPMKARKSPIAFPSMISSETTPGRRIGLSVF
jgi:hypothetical protein